MADRAPRKVLLASLALLLIALACQLPISATATDTAVPPSPTPPPPIAPTPSARLSGQDLPALSFGPPGQSVAGEGRPALSGPAQTLDTEHFRIHYTLEGADAPPPADANSNQHPDWVEEMAVALEYSWSAEIEHFGWGEPPSDQGLGGDDRYDVYIADITEEGADGLTEGDYETGFYGDNPNTSIVESRGSSSFITLNVQMAHDEEKETDKISPLQYARAVAAHEWMHAIQHGYDALEAHDWFWEATANWMEEEVFDDYNEPNAVLNGVFKAPDSCLLSEGGVHQLESESHWYSLWIFIRYLSERFGHDFVRELWEAAVLEEGFAVWDQVLADYGTTLESVFRAYSLALLTRDFQEGAGYPAIRLEGEMGLERIFSPGNGVAQFAADYVQIHANQPITVTLTGEGMEGQLVGIASGQAHVFPLDSGSASVDPGLFDHLYLTVLNLQRPPSEVNCGFADYEVFASAGGSPRGPTASLPAPNFVAPSVEIRLADLGLSYIPAGFEFYSGYQMPREDYIFPDFVDVVIPGTGPAYVLDYFDANDNYISVYASESPFANLDEFLEQQSNYTPSEIDARSADDRDYFLVDYSGQDGLFSTATFILDGLFIVIEGNASLAELDATVRSYLTREEPATIRAESAAYADLALVYIPPGFEFYDAYTQERDEFYNQEAIEWFVPGPGPVTILDYFNREDQYIAVDASQSPFATLQDFLNEMGYTPTPGELVTIGGRAVLLEDFTDAEGPLSFATFIYQGLFIVIEGEIDKGEMQRVVEAWFGR